MCCLSVFLNLSLEELHISLNDFSKVELGSSESEVHPNLKRLHFTGKIFSNVKWLFLTKNKTNKC